MPAPSVDPAWEAFDASALRLQSMYRAVDPAADTTADRAQRRKLAMETARLWDEFRSAFVGGSK